MFHPFIPIIIITNEHDDQATAGLDGAVILYDFKTEFDLIVRCYIQVGLLCSKQVGLLCNIQVVLSWTVQVKL